MNLTKTLLFVFLGIFLLSSVSASLVYADWSDGSREITITQGDSVSFNADFFSMNPPMTISAVLYDSSDNAVYTFVEQSVTGYSFSGIYTITPEIYLTTGTFELILNGIDKINHQNSDSIILIVNPSTPTNNAPVITSTAVTSVNENTAYSYDVEATDADGNTLTYSLTQNPAWLSINANTGVISGTSPSVTSNSDADITVRVSDGTDYVEQSYTLTVNNIPGSNNAPIITILGNNPENIIIGSTYTDAGATATDVEDGNLTSSITTSGTVNTNIVGIYTITYSVTDSNSNTVTATRTVNVVALSDTIAPVITIISPINGGVYDSVTTFQFQVTDTSTITCTYSVQGGVQNVNVPCISGQTINVSLNAVDGTNTWSITAIDSFGNTATTSISFTINEDGDGGDGRISAPSGKVILENEAETENYMKQFQPKPIRLWEQEKELSWFQRLIQAIVNFFRRLVR